MIIFRYYDKKKRIDRVWYESSNILFTECEDPEDALKTLRITFKTGDVYEYKNVNVNDYLIFSVGGADASNGKTFWKVIKPKYEGVKIGHVEPSAVAALMEQYKVIKKKELQEASEQETVTENVEKTES